MDDTSIRLAIFLTVFTSMALAEALFPRRKLGFAYRRWPANLAIVLLNSLIVRLLFPAGAIGAAVWADANGVGLLNLIDLPASVVIIISIALLDLIIYWQHVIFHAVPVLWRLHAVHHADRDIDVTTGLRFHPLEIILSMLIKISFVIALGIPATAVLIFEVILNGMAMFNHANVHLPKKVDAVLRLLLITPDVHRVHHSVNMKETNSNFGFNLSIWDRLFGTWCAQPALGHNNTTIGIAELQHAPTHTLTFMLSLPFRGRLGQYPNHDRK